MVNIKWDFGDGLVIGFILMVLVFSIGGFVFAQSDNTAITLVGESMSPSYESGCNIAVVDKFDENTSIDENDVIVFNPSTIDSDKVIFHRVIYEYDSFNYEQDIVRQRVNGEVENIYQLENRDIKNNWYITNQSVDQLKDMNGKEVYITKGDANKTPDAELVTKDKILYTVNNNYYFHISDNPETCSCTPIVKLVRIL
jgi:signal peptidase I